MTVALIAGTGGVPPIVARALDAQGRPPIVCEMSGFASGVTGEYMRVPFRIETLGTFLNRLQALDVTEVCMVGAMQRPNIDPTAVDAATAPLIETLVAAMAQGDDGTLRAIVALFEERGMTVVGAHQIAPQLLPAAGVLTQTLPPDLTVDVSVATRALAEMGQADLGQAMIVNKGHVIAREDARGTDALLQDFCADRPAPHEAPHQAPHQTSDPFSTVMDTASDLLGGAADWLSGRDGHAPQTEAVGGFLFKGPKPDQDLRVDMPTIGPSTAARAREAGLAGIVIQEGGVMIVDAPAVIATLNAAGLYLWVSP
ncbi:LpxI family protein [Pseudooctadecabacter jejudonensis]|uniref:Phosphatidate cytidylyltransferase n=1 Tax=Pseudooctadecabacter jejudonensis TaxID=1391910 RepID=A0A1Y5RGH0_9RHOB|nr:UDP-2,3-diacylglucosamine diphosphatase LpxI [Pseudooctadecabacter jejudonensis]SLN16860.1 hypothetical protein PSJ8397_00465 [Pseudooctadecabacter jejudonensis]